MPFYARLNTGISDGTGNWRELVSGRWFCLPLLWSLLILARCQDCDFPATVPFTVNETDPAGTELFSVSSRNGSNVYTYTTQDGWLKEFLNLTLNDTDFYYRMQLNKPLDLEEIYYNLSVTDISGFTFTLHCKSQTDRLQDYHIIVEAVNEWPPEFNTTSIHLSVKETLPLRSVLINLTQWSSDNDVHPISREIAGYSFLRYTGDPQIDGHAWLDMLIAYDGIVVVKKELDYEALPPDRKYVLLGVQVADQGGKTGTASLTVYVEDDDDLPPLFDYPGCRQPCRVTYSVSVSANFTGHVTRMKPAPIEAHDGDALNYTIEYNIVQGTGDYAHYLDINHTNGHLFILQELGELGHSTLVLIVEAREVSQNSRSTTTMLIISVQDERQEATVISSDSDNDDTVVIVSVILGAVVIVVVVLLVIMMVYLKKRSRKPVFPANSGSIVQGGLELLNGISHQTSKQQSNEETHAGETDPSTILDSKDYGYADIEPSTTAARHKSQLFSKTPTNEDTNSAIGGGNESPSSDLVAAFDDDSVDLLEPVSENHRNIKFQSTSTDTEVDPMAGNNQNPGDPNSPTRPAVTVVSGLKALEGSQDIDGHYLYSDVMGKHSEGTGIYDTDSYGPKSARSVPKRKKSRKRQESRVDQEEIIYDGEEMFGNVEFDSGFYTDSTKTRIKRSTRKSVVLPDPNDIRHWLTVQDD